MQYAFDFGIVVRPGRYMSYIVSMKAVQHRQNCHFIPGRTLDFIFGQNFHPCAHHIFAQTGVFLHAMEQIKDPCEFISIHSRLIRLYIQRLVYQLMKQVVAAWLSKQAK